MPIAVLSIRYKIIIAFAAVYLFMAASFLGSHYFIHQLEQKIGYLEDISKLEESVLEIRRFEKNFFLYGDYQSLNTALYHLTRVQDVLGKNNAKLEELSYVQKVAEFKKDLADYKDVISRCSQLAAQGDRVFTPEIRGKYETEMRKTGSSLLDFAEGVARRKRESIKQTTSTAVKLQLLAFALVGVGLVGVGSFLFAKVMKPLILLEQSTDDIAKGRFKPIENLPHEKEIREIFDSFNRMTAQLKTREEQLVQSKKLASLGTMLAGVAHEVNNPLSNISSSCEILLEELDEGDKEYQRGVLRKVVEQVDKARSIVLNLLEFSRNKEFFKQSVNLKEIIDSTIRLLHGQIPSTVLVTAEIPEDLAIFADKQRIQQAFMNLITNAVQAVQGEGEVRIRAEISRHGMVTMIVRDTGVGIPEENLSKIFDPFFTTKDVGQGTGLGLFITHDIIVRHGGTIKAKSSPGTGTSFVIRLPAREPSE
ncbi:MAG TPA: ATP-binding protein [Desulfomonilaceae bacterium]|nr:ATP-binding protein [Desulfomonilaceae bacterium]